MLSKAFLVSFVILGLGLQVSAHAGVTPALGVNGQFTRNDVQKPTAAKPCGNTPLTNIDTSTPVTAAADGTVKMTATGFDSGTDGSREITAVKVDSSGTGQQFKAAPANAIITNGDASPTQAGSQAITMQMPAGTTCSGGKSKNLCMVALQTKGGFGNCVVVQQGGAAGAAGNSTADATSAGGNSTVTPAGGASNGTASADGSKTGKKKGAKRDRRAIGSRAARAYLEAILAEME